MSTYERSWVRVLTLGFGRASIDLTVAVVTVLTTMVMVLLNAPVGVRAPLAVVVVSFVPGYVLTVAVFPRGESWFGAASRQDTRGEGISMLDRLVLSVGLSLSVVVVIGLGVNLAPVAITTETMLDGITVQILATTPIAYYRRQSVPAAERYAPIFFSDSLTSRTRFALPSLDFLHLAIILSVLFAGGMVALSTGPVSDEGGVTELYFQGEPAGPDEAVGYSTNLTADESTTVPVAIGNHEGDAVHYTVVGQLERLDRTNETETAGDTGQILQQNVMIPAGQTQTINTTVTPETAGRYRLTYRLYTGDSPDIDDPAAASQEIHLQITVAEEPPE